MRKNGLFPRNTPLSISTTTPPLLPPVSMYNPLSSTVRFRWQPIPQKFQIHIRFFQPKNLKQKSFTPKFQLYIWGCFSLPSEKQKSFIQKFQIHICGYAPPPFPFCPSRCFGRHPRYYPTHEVGRSRLQRCLACYTAFYETVACRYFYLISIYALGSCFRSLPISYRKTGT